MANSVEVVLTTDQLSIIGGPSNVTLQTDFGPTGPRGNYIFVGNGAPTSLNPDPSTIKAGDLYINTNAGPDYSWLYQYILQPAGYTWSKIIKINPAIYNKISSVTFTAGAAVGAFSIPLTSITSASVVGLTTSNFAVDVVFQNSTKPVSLYITKSIVSGNLIVDVHAISYSGGTWSNVTGPFDLAINIAMVF